MTRPITIATLYRHYPGGLHLTHMAPVRWLRMSEALARLGFMVDVIADPDGSLAPATSNLRFVSPADFRPADYDVIKTLFHRGYEALAGAGGEQHPFIISKLGSVAGATDDVPGVHFVGDERTRLYEVQQRIQRRSRYITVLTEPSKGLWERELGPRDTLLLVPTGVDARIPPPNGNPFREFEEKIAVYVGTLYVEAQRHINLLWQRRLNRIGRLLRERGIRLCLVGPGLIDELDPSAVTYLGVVENERVWDYHHFADVGVVLAQGPVQHNESSKLYYYLRAGLPVVSEAPVPNNDVLHEAGLGLVADYDDDRMMADMIEEAAARRWPREAAVAYVLAHHTWERRAQLYADVIHRDLGR